MSVRVFYHEPTLEAHEKGPVHFQDSEDGVHIVPETVCGVGIPPDWHIHIVGVDISDLPPAFEVLCPLCVAMDLLRCVSDKIDRLILSEAMLMQRLKGPDTRHIRRKSMPTEGMFMTPKEREETFSGD